MARINPEGERRGPARSFLGALNTYVQPERDVSGARALQEGLGQLSSSLGQWQRKAQAEQNESDYQQGKADYLRKAAGQEPEGIKRGTLFRSQSKFYAMGLAEATGEAKAIDWSNGLQTAYKQWDGRGSSDPDKFRSWMNQQSAEFLQELGENDHALAAAMPYINRANQSMAKHHVAYRDEQMRIARFNAFDTKVQSIFDQTLNEEWDTLSPEVQDEQLAAALEREVNLMIGGGENGTATVNALVAKAVSYANARNDLGLIEQLARMHDNGKFKLSIENIERLADGYDAVGVDIERENNHRATQEAAVAKKLHSDTMAAWSTALTQDPWAKLPDPNTVPPETWEDMKKFQDAVIKGTENISPEQAAINTQNIDRILNDPETGPDQKIRDLYAYAELTPVPDLPKHVQRVLDMYNPDTIIGSSTYKNTRLNLMKNISSAIKFNSIGGEGEPPVLSIIRTHYDEYVHSEGHRFTNTVKGIRDLTKEAKEYAISEAYEHSPVSFDALMTGNADVVRALDIPRIVNQVDMEQRAKADAEKAEAMAARQEEIRRDFAEMAKLNRNEKVLDPTFETIEEQVSPEVMSSVVDIAASVPTGRFTRFGEGGRGGAVISAVQAQHPELTSSQIVQIVPELSAPEAPVKEETPEVDTTRSLSEFTYFEKGKRKSVDVMDYDGRLDDLPEKVKTELEQQYGSARGLIPNSPFGDFLTSKSGNAFVKGEDKGDQGWKAAVQSQIDAEKAPKPKPTEPAEPKVTPKRKPTDNERKVKVLNESSEIEPKMIAQARGIIKSIPQTRGFGASVTRALKQAFPNLLDDQILELVTRLGTETK